MIDKKALEFTIGSKNEGDDEQKFLAIKTGRRDGAGGWFNVYLYDGESGDYEHVSTVDAGRDLIGAAMDYMVEQMKYGRENLSVRPDPLAAVEEAPAEGVPLWELAPSAVFAVRDDDGSGIEVFRLLDLRGGVDGGPQAMRLIQRPMSPVPFSPDTRVLAIREEDLPLTEGVA